MSDSIWFNVFSDNLSLESVCMIEKYEKKHHVNTNTIKKIRINYPKENYVYAAQYTILHVIYFYFICKTDSSIIDKIVLFELIKDTKI